MSSFASVGEDHECVDERDKKDKKDKRDKRISFLLQRYCQTMVDGMTSQVARSLRFMPCESIKWAWKVWEVISVLPYFVNQDEIMEALIHNCIPEEMIVQIELFPMHPRNPLHDPLLPSYDDFYDDSMTMVNIVLKNIEFSNLQPIVLQSIHGRIRHKHVFQAHRLFYSSCVGV